MENAAKKIITHFVLDTDGVLTDGTFVYTAEGKIAKVYGPDDSDALSVLAQKVQVHFISGDKRGFGISKKRVEDMGFPIDLVSTYERLAWLNEHFPLHQTVFMADGIFDSLVFPHVAYSIAPQNAFPLTRQRANFVTTAAGGSGAVAEACLHIMDTFFEPFHLEDLDFSKGSGAWKKA